ncbi:MAG: RluA family pseudouridine synthase [Bacteroidales bacterium]|nr:RluA family pseudouridine synthase [Bacteroidales bacterium]
MLEILYEDNHIIVVNKKPSDIVQGDKTGDKPLSEFVKDYIKTKYNKPGAVFIGVVHRIDRPASGIVLFARTSKALTRLTKMFHDKEIKKTYWAVVRNKPPEESGRLTNYIKKYEEKNISKVYNVKMEGAVQAELIYEVIKNTDGYYLLEIDLLTGRHHQIRAQLASIGCPIIGDNKYGYPRANRDYSINLHARSMEFIHPVKKELIKIIAKPPIDAIWKKF